MIMMIDVQRDFNLININLLKDSSFLVKSDLPITVASVELFGKVCTCCPLYTKYVYNFMTVEGMINGNLFRRYLFHWHPRKFFFVCSPS